MRKLLRIETPLILLGILLIPLRTSSVEKTEYQNRELAYVVAAYSPQIEKKPLIEKIEIYKTENHKSLKQIPSQLGFNCVTYAKSRRDIGTGYGSLNQKIGKIKTKIPFSGAVGVTREGWSGHLVYVEKVKENTLIISEGNFHRGFITWREIPKSLVVGYL